MIKLRIDLENLVAKGRDAVRLTKEQDEKIAGKIGKRKGQLWITKKQTSI